ncbi:MAG: peptide ABC transporter substrate-binding protein [Chloroflexi bacterium]|nr:peptide ABC transporter substrate-binding protein [Chloroflexota bacterium]
MPNRKLTPDVAKRWEVTQGGRVYVFELRQDVYWSDGVPVTAQDFVFAWQRVLDPNNKAGRAPSLFAIRNAESFHQGESDSDALGVKAVDKYTLEIKLERPVGYFLQVLTLPAAFPVPSHVIAAHGDNWTDINNIVCNGPFILTELAEGISVQLSRNPKYHGYFPGNLQQIHFGVKQIRADNPDVLLNLYTDDQLDIMFLSPFRREITQSLIRKLPSNYLTFPTGGYVYVAFKVGQFPFDDLRVRQAFAHAVDKTKLTNIVLDGLDSAANGGLVPPGIPGHSAGIGLGYDPDRARELFAQAGYKHGSGFPTLELFTYVSGDSISTVGVKFLQEEWKAVLGVNTHVSTFPVREMQSRWRAGQAEIIVAGWVFDYPDPQNVHSIERLESWGLSDWHNENYRNLINKAEQSQVPAERIQIYQQAEKILINQVPIMPLVYSTNHFLRKPWVKSAYYGLERGILGKDIIIEPH